MFCYAFFILPYVLLAAAFFVFIRAALRSNSPTRRLLVYPTVSSLIITSGFTLRGVFFILTSRSSTAGIGFLFLPFYSFAVAIIAYLVSWSLFCLARFFNSRREKTSDKLSIFLPVVVALLMLSVTGFTAQKWIARNWLLNTAASTSIDAVELEAILERAISCHDLEVLSKLAKNPKTPTNDLIRIYDSCKDRVAEFNPLEYMVFFSLAQNPQTPSDTLAVLAECQQSTIRVMVGMNPDTPNETLYQLAKDKDDQVRTWLATNPKIPKELLLQLAEDPDRIVRNYAGTNLSKRGFGTVSQDNNEQTKGAIAE